MIFIVGRAEQNRRMIAFALCVLTAAATATFAFVACGTRACGEKVLQAFIKTRNWFLKLEPPAHLSLDDETPITDRDYDIVDATCYHVPPAASHSADDIHAPICTDFNTVARVVRYKARDDDVVYKIIMYTEKFPDFYPPVSHIDTPTLLGAQMSYGSQSFLATDFIRALAGEDGTFRFNRNVYLRHVFLIFASMRNLSYEEYNLPKQLRLFVSDVFQVNVEFTDEQIKTFKLADVLGLMRESVA
jgi:hypothetical protein